MSKAELITLQESDTQLAKPKDPKQELLKKIEFMLSENKNISLDDALSTTVLDALFNAVAPDNQGELHTDFKTRLKAFELLMKLKDSSFGWNQFMLNFFAAPKDIDY